MTRANTLRNPRYTGTRRCWPCTTVNLGIVAVATAVLLAVSRPLAAGVVALVGVTAVWLRGYVIPFTPRFAPRLVAAIPGAKRVFDHTATTAGAADRAGDDALARSAATEQALPSQAVVLDRLAAVGVVVSDDEELTLATPFRERWEAAIRNRREDDIETVAAAVEKRLSAVSVTVASGDVGRGPYVVVSKASQPSVDDAWLTRPVAIAELAAIDALEALDAPELDQPTRIAAAGPLRLFIETCPACGGRVVETTTVECCGGTAGAGAGADAVLACEACETRLITLPT